MLNDGEQSPRRAGTGWLLIALVFSGGCGCGTTAVALLWLSSVLLSMPNPANTPESLLAARSAGKASATITPFVLKSRLTPADMAFGEQQMQRMIADRPVMTWYVKKGDAVWRYCAGAFAGEAIGEHIFWRADDPDGESLADHQGPYQGEKGYIRVRSNYPSGHAKGSLLPCEELWACAVYELENIRNTPSFNALFGRAWRGKI